ncbi:GD15577 [Drosophila simulans]|uniref:GD15577 n=1 Tax=Drosophila simulans TaxID=7240 RepID=B4R7R1_DROSI|nr:GD15577 [Drosophila simulans]
MVRDSADSSESEQESLHCPQVLRRLVLNHVVPCGSCVLPHFRYRWTHFRFASSWIA